MTDHRNALVPPSSPQDEARKRWTRPTIFELGNVKVTEGATAARDVESGTHYPLSQSS